MNINKYIKNWARIIGESCDDVFESYENDNTEATEFVNNYAKENGYKFCFKKSCFETVDDAFKAMSKEMEPILYAKIKDSIYEDPERFDISYYDDSDLDPEYGYGHSGEYSEKEIESTAKDETNEQIKATESDLVEKYLDWKNNGNDQDYASWLNDVDDEAKVCWNDEYDFGIRMEKKV